MLRIVLLLVLGCVKSVRYRSSPKISAVNNHATRFDKAGAKVVAKWMAEQLAQHHVLDMEQIGVEIRDRFGEEFVHQTPGGGLSINNQVLRAFGEINGDDVVWEQAKLRWTYRQPFHRPGRMQD